IPMLTTVSAMITSNAELVSEGFTGNASVNGVEPIYIEDLAKRELLHGRMMKHVDLTTYSDVCLISEKGLKTMDCDQSILGKTVKINMQPFTVVGILKEDLQAGKLFDTGDEVEVFIPYTSAQKLFQLRNVYWVSCKRSEEGMKMELKELLKRVELVLRAKTGFRYDYEVEALSEQLAEINRILTILTLVIGAIGALSLIVGGIGVMNIMLVSVTERTREIGIRVAVGAKTWSLIWQFLIETMTVCFLGGLGGIGLGVLLVLGISQVPKIPVVISQGSIVAGIVFSLVTGIVFGIYPAFKASRLDPIECLRYE
ncbi:MAG: ABC transporter permease, partial [Candidatus Wallbacteria bacterium]|nr:ABC transporter permease [Candidatus Wallbacteria bacterium]